jgi:hypothetical protein
VGQHLLAEMGGIGRPAPSSHSTVGATR